MAIDTIKATAILDGSVDTADLADNAVTTAKITDGNVTSAKIGDGEVTSAKLDTNIDIAGTLDVTGVTTLDDDLNVDSGTLFVDASTNRVGVGATSPSQLLELSGTGGPRINIIDEDDGQNSQIRSRQGDMFLLSDSDVAIFPSNTETARFEANGDFKFNSGYGSVATAYGCRAWVNFNGTGTVAIREDGNVSSITDRAQGKYTVNFSVAMPDANYCATYTPSSSAENVEDDRQVSLTNLTSSSFYITSSDTGDNSWADAFTMCAAVFR